jgi:hypothetical protein
MKMKNLLLILSCCVSFSLFSQEADCPFFPSSADIGGNRIQTAISSNGRLFFDDEETNFQVPYTGANSTSTIFAANFWTGGYLNGDLGASFGTYIFDTYVQGPIEAIDGELTPLSCQDWDRVWSVSRWELVNHLLDYADNLNVDHPLPSIFGWPGKGNPYFETYHGFPLPLDEYSLAPFFDKNNDGIYDPGIGEYPQPPSPYEQLPYAMLNWAVFNDINEPVSPSSGEQPLNIEIQVSGFTIACTDNDTLNNTLFTHHKVINKNDAPIDSFFVGIWTDFDIGCYTDDAIGSTPDQHSFFGYNVDLLDGNFDGDCPFGIPTYQLNPPAQSVTFLNSDLDHFIYYINDGIPALTNPETGKEAYHYLNGAFRDGIPLTFGDDGYGGTTPATHAFPDDPNDPDGWSLQTFPGGSFDRRVIGSSYWETLEAGESRSLATAWTFHQQPDGDYLQNVSQMYETLDYLLSSGPDFACTVPSVCTQNCVWPGDANADSLVDHRDLLYLALASNATGPVRNSPLNWSAYFGADWSSLLPNGKNMKHADCDGNGLVELESDFFISRDHYRSSIPGYLQTDEYPAGPDLTVEPFATSDFENVTLGSTQYGRIFLNNYEDLFALGFTLEYDTTYVETIAIIESTECAEECLDWLSEEQTAGPFFERDIAWGGKDLDFALPTTEALAVLEISIKDDIPLNTPGLTKLKIKNLQGFRKDGFEYPLGATAANLWFPDLAPSATKEIPQGVLRLFPNPANAQVRIEMPWAGDYTIELFDTMGKRLRSTHCKNCPNLNWDLQDIPTGIYMIRAAHDGQRWVSRLVKH